MVNGFESLTVADRKMFSRLGIGSDLLERARIERVTDQQALENFGIICSGDKSGILFPYYGPANGARYTARLRRDHPEIEDGKPRGKYISAYGDRRHLYFVPGCVEQVTDTTIAVMLVEAEKSALALTAWSERTGQKILPIGMGGAWGWRGRIGKKDSPDGGHLDEKGALPELGICADREVIVMLDANASRNADVSKAQAALVRTLVGYRARVRIATIPAIEGVNGPDDLIAHGGDPAILSVLELAKPVLEVAFADAERAIDAIYTARSDCKAGELIRAIKTVADDRRTQRSCLGCVRAAGCNLGIHRWDLGR